MKLPPYRVVTPTIDDMIASLLVEWWGWHDAYTYGGKQNHRNGSAVTQDYVAPGHMDWWNGSADERAEFLRLKFIDEAVTAIKDEPQPWQTALRWHARNLHGHRVIIDSPRLPTDREEREVLVLEARNLFAAELRRRNLLGDT